MSETDSTNGESIIDRLRGSPVGVNDPTIVGDAGPTDQPPGSDGDALVVDQPIDSVGEPDPRAGGDVLIDPDALLDGGGGDPGPEDV